MKRQSLVNTGDISPEIAYDIAYRLRRNRLRRNGIVKEMGFQLLKKKRG